MIREEYHGFFVVVVVGKNDPPKDVHILIPRTCEHVTFHETGGFVDVIKLRIFNEIILDCLEEPM